MHRTSGLIVCACSMLIVALNAMAASQSERPDFSAELHVTNHINGELYSYTISLGKHGSRSEIQHPKFGKLITIANSKQQKCRTYLLDKQAYYEEVLDPNSPDCDLDLDRIYGEYADTINTDSYHALGSVSPCGAIAKQKLGTDIIHTRQAEKWLCTNKEIAKTFTQWYDPQLGRVIKHQEDKVTKEYQKIRIQPLPESLFAPMSGFQKYDQQAFYKLLRIPAFNKATADTAMDKLLPNDRLQVCMEKCQSTVDNCAATAKGENDLKKCDTAFDQCAATCEKLYPPQ